MNRANHPFAASAAASLAQLLRVPLVRVSDWQIASDDSLTASAADVEVGSFTMIVANRRTAQALTVKGVGAGAGVGVGLSPVDVSGDPQTLPNAPGPLGALANVINQIGARVKLPKLPGLNSPIFLGPGGTDSMGPRLFAGSAALYNLALGAGIEIGCGVLVFSGGAGIKALAILAGLDYLSNASIGASGLVYLVTATPLNQCTVTTV
ncbi:MAG: hypothetical protein WAN51_01155 [Alphaproteobacteria bacterium]